MKKYKGVIFDLDGTLLNTIEDLSDSVNSVLEVYKYPLHGYEEYKLKIGNGFRNLLEVSFPEGTMNDSIMEEALKRFLSLYDKRYMCKTVPYDGIVNLLEQLDEKGVKIAVNSNKRTDYTNNLIKKFFPQIRFSGIIGERIGISKKPDPTSVFELLDLMKLDSKDVIYVGDSKVDMMTGKNAEMDKAGVLWGFRGREELEMYKADYIIKTPNELLSLF